MFSKYCSVLQLIDYLGGSIEGRKKLQKLVYLIQHKGGPFKEVFQYHLYGPFSEQLANELEEMRGFGLVEEIKELGVSGHKYRYSLTDDGKKLLQSMPGSGLDPFEELIRDLGQYDARHLELMATCLFLSENSNSIGENSIATSVKHLKREQNYNNDEIRVSLQYLRDHRFVKRLEGKEY